MLGDRETKKAKTVIRAALVVLLLVAACSPPRHYHYDKIRAEQDRRFYDSLWINHVQFL